MPKRRFDYIERRPVVQIGWLIAEKRALAMDPDEWTLALLAQINDNEGWSYETSGSMGSVIRHEAVRLNADDLALAWAFSTLGMDFIIDPEHLPEPTLDDAQKLLPNRSEATDDDQRHPPSA